MLADPAPPLVRCVIPGGGARAASSYLRVRIGVELEVVLLLQELRVWHVDRQLRRRTRDVCRHSKWTLAREVDALFQSRVDILADILNTFESNIFWRHASKERGTHREAPTRRAHRPRSGLHALVLHLNRSSQHTPE
jgi:hypothetical protein